MHRQRILFCAYGGGHIKALLPVIRHFLAHPGVDVSILGLTAAGPILEEAGIAHFGFKDFVRPGDEDALAVGRELAKGLPPGFVDPEESVAYLGLSYAELAGRVGREEAEREYALRGRGAFLPTGVLERVFDQERPDLVIATNSPRAEQAALLVARERGIPSLCLVDLYGILELPWLSLPGFGTRLCVLNEGVARIMEEAGRLPQEIHVTGNPAFDSLGDPSLPSRGAALRREAGWDGRNVFLWASCPDPRDPGLMARIEKALRSCVEHRQDWHLVIRPHPNEFRESLDAGHPRVTISRPGEPLHPLLFAVDAVVTTISTVGIEAWLAGTPLVTCDASPLAFTAPYSRYGLSHGAPEPDDLEGVLAQVFMKASGQPRPAPTPACPRVVGVAESLLARRGRSGVDGPVGF